ncbi:hypothetical protein [Methyloterricola oryzae]|uniref:hypothetical protein n=1 Tax=Methyloterricola oryzae TaxID=1495050 RepID=UPI0005EBEF30|nr:hypothetical protein [Methyloterricola oryzae]
MKNCNTPASRPLPRILPAAFAAAMAGSVLLPQSSLADPDFVETNAVPWLLVRIVGAQDDTAGGSKLTPTTFIQRINTSGGVAPSTG